MVSLNRRESLLVAVAGPAVLWLVVSVAWLGAAAVGMPRRFDGRSMTLTEATAVASYADAARLLGGGADPNAPARLRAGIVDLHTHMMRPLEAATGAVRTGPLQMLIEHGASIDESNYPVLWCGAMAHRNRDMLRFLEARRPAAVSSPVDCANVGSLW